jgi:hypothetical protein
MSEPSRRLFGLVITALVIAVAALGLAGWALFQQSHDEPSEQAYSDTERADAKAKTCAAFDLVRSGVTRNTNLAAPGGDSDITGSIAVAANARISLYDGGQYLLARTGPATPRDLAEAVEKFGDNLMDIGAAATNGVQNTEPAQAARLADADTSSASIATMCQ